jgi:hypothetical protein
MVGFCELNDGFSKFRGISRLADKLLASSERLYSMELVTLGLLLFYVCYLYIKDSGQLKNPGVDHRIILKLILNEAALENMKWISLAQGSEQWHAFLDAVMNNERVP